MKGDALAPPRRLGEAMSDALVRQMSEAPPPDAATLTQIYAAWSRVGAYVSIAPTAHPVALESLIVDTARVAHEDERLLMVVVSWLAASHGVVDGHRFATVAATLADTLHTSAALGAILSWADELSG